MIQQTKKVSSYVQANVYFIVDILDQIIVRDTGINPTGCIILCKKRSRPFKVFNALTVNFDHLVYVGEE